MRAIYDRCWGLVFLSAATLSLFTGCSDSVQEDRTIQFSPTSEATSFQHGDDGVYVVTEGKAEKIFQPDERVLATSTPLWSPDGSRMIFTTAKPITDQPSVPGTQDWDDNPQGRMFRTGSVVYTCWLKTKPAGETTTKPQPLFEAPISHSGYVAANLAVRWFPDGRRLAYVTQLDNHLSGLFEYDIESKEKQQIFPHSAAAITFDWSPDQAHLVCVLGNIVDYEKQNGIWIGQPGQQQEWWHIPLQEVTRKKQTAIQPTTQVEGEEPVQIVETGALIRQLRSQRPVWTKAGRRFAFVDNISSNSEITYQVHSGQLKTRQLDLLYESKAILGDLYWSPDGDRLGLVRHGNLHFLELNGDLSPPLNKRVVRHFAGWDSSGEKLAYVVPDEIPLNDGDHWAFLMLPDRLARDALILADDSEPSRAKAVFSGMRVTFPHWSPRDNRLSFWGTYSPTHTSWFSILFNQGLRRGDPAATIDSETGALTWMPINAHEKVQVGHYHLLKQDYKEAMRWYDEATAELPPAESPSIEDLVNNVQGRRNFAFFHYYCLKKLGLEEDAQTKLEQFRRTFLPRLPTLNSSLPSERQQEELLRQLQLLDPNGFTALLLRDFYIAEVFLSLDAAEAGEIFFADKLQTETTETVRLSTTIALTQILLLQQSHSQYADHLTRHVMPLILRHWNRLPESEETDAMELAAIMPMYSADFLKLISSDQLGALTLQWEKLQNDNHKQISQLALDLFLHEAYPLLNRQSEQAAVADRIKQNPARIKIFPDGDVQASINGLRKLRSGGLTDERISNDADGNSTSQTELAK